MEGIIQFVMGSVWSVLLMTGAIWAYLWVNSRLRARDNEATPIVKPPQEATRAETPPIRSGIVKAITPQEIKDEKNKGFINKMKEIIE
jgi:hypothetical protein